MLSRWLIMSTDIVDSNSNRQSRAKEPNTPNANQNRRRVMIPWCQEELINQNILASNQSNEVITARLLDIEADRFCKTDMMRWWVRLHLIINAELHISRWMQKSRLHCHCYNWNLDPRWTELKIHQIHYDHPWTLEQQIPKPSPTRRACGLTVSSLCQS